MSNPTVCAVMLTRDRHELARRAIQCFKNQTYQNKALLIYDTGEKYLDVGPEFAHAKAPESMRGLPIGALRNNANALVNADVIVHWDDDDWSHPSRIAEQVKALQSSGVDVVGYNEMLFWREPRAEHLGRVKDAFGPGMLDHANLHPGEAWLYSNTVRSDYALGTSLMYWRKTWESKPFDDARGTPGGYGEDAHFIQGLKVLAFTSLVWDSGRSDGPSMVASIHGGNTMPYNIEAQIQSGSKEWLRVTGWDERVKFIMGAQ